jgi:hypothetical protein
MDTPQIDDVLIFGGQIAIAVTAIIGLLTIIYRFSFKNIKDDIGDIRSQLHPNSGTSMRDAVNRLESGQKEITSELKNLRQKIDDHITWHLDQ